MSRKKSLFKQNFANKTIEIGNRHKQARRNLKLTLKDLEAEFKISHALLSQCENGKSEFPLSYIVQFCEKHGINLFWLIWGGELSVWAEEFFKSPPVQIAGQREIENSYSTIGDVRKDIDDEQKKLYEHGLVHRSVIKNVVADAVDRKNALQSGFLSLDIKKQFGLIFQAMLRWPLTEVERFQRIIHDYLENQKGEKP